jgi:Tfp pilus assembly protein PilX
MKPLNQAERSSAFLNFLLLFMLTIAVIMTVIFFSIKVPFKQNEHLRYRITLNERDQEFAASFSLLLKETLEELNKFEESKEPASVTTQRVQFKVDELYQKARLAPDAENSIYGIVARSMNDLNAAKAKVKRMEADQGYIQK